MLETTGVKLIKTCIDCKNDLDLNSNWTEARQAQGKYLCKSCWSLRDSARMFVNGAEITKKHPLYKAGRYKTFESAAFSALEGYSKSTVGYVYVVSNPAWEGWFKVGKAVDAYDRCSQYQTSSPYRDYVVEYCKYFEDRKKAESQAHALLKGTEQRGEWFRAELSVIKNTIKTIEGV